MKKRNFKNFTLENVKVADAATDGRGVVRDEGRKIFIPYTVPEDVVDIYVYDVKKRLFTGSLVEVKQKSPHRIEPKCKHFGVCGGCKWQMMNYQTQLFYKNKQVNDIFDRIAKIEVKERRSILGSETDYFYRNKLEFSFSNKLWIPREDLDKGIDQNRNVLGFHVPKVFDKLIDIQECHLQTPIISEILNEMRRYSIEQNISCYDFKEHTGFLRNFMFRTSAATGELMLVLIVANENKKLLDEIFTHLESKFPEIQHFIYIINNKLNSSFSDLPFHVWKGKPYIIEKLGNFQYQISPTSFFQTNPTQADTLYKVAKDMLREVLSEGNEKHKIVYDLYTGTGSIAIYVSDLAEKIVGIEYVESSIIDAKKNCQINDIQHINFYAGDMAKVLTEELVKREGKPDVIITDPPRAGMAKKVIVQILKTLPKHIIYISCHPATQARDVDMMRDYYEVEAIQPVDMFPQTAHVENVCLLKRKENITQGSVESMLQRFEEKGMEKLDEMLEE